ncbi:hypothetical protein [Microbacterium aureliae]
MADEVGGPDGYSYSAVLLPAETDAAPSVDAVLHDLRFSGWIAPPAGGWQVLIGDPGAGVVARGRRGIVEVAAVLAAELRGGVIALQVRRDRQLAIVAWQDGAEVARYCSDPSIEPGADRQVLAEPVGEDDAPEIAAVAGRPGAAEDLQRLLAEELDPDSVYESERLRSVLRLLGLPDWVVAASSLPRDIPTGPRAAELIRMRAGEQTPAAVATHVLVKRKRRRHAPPPIIADPPRQDDFGIDPWLL